MFFRIAIGLILLLLLLNATNSYSATYYGSGFFVNEYHIVTNRHVIDKCDSIQLTYGRDFKRFPAKLIATAKYNDLALLESSFRSKYNVKLPISIVARRGDIVYTAGYSSGDFKFIETLLLAKNWWLELAKVPGINPGDSGAPVLNSKGTLSGVVVSAHKPLFSTSIIINAIKVSSVKKFLINTDTKYSDSSIELLDERIIQHFSIMIICERNND